MKYIRKFKILTCFVLIVNFILFNCIYVYAYDMSAPHEVNLYYKDPNEVAKIQKQLWGEMRTWGMTEAGCAGTIGNMMAESGCDYTRMQSNKSWSQFKKGRVGIGLTQWTFPTRQDQLFATADELNKQWNVLLVQATQLKKELAEGGSYYIEELYTSNDINKCADRFLEVYEKPAHYNYSTRRQLANSVYNSLKGTEPKKIDGSSNSSSEESKEDVSTEHVKSVVSEFELIGMSSFKNNVASEQEEVVLAKREDLSIGEQYSVTTIGEDLSIHKRALTIDNARVAVVFVGLCMIFYSVLLGLAVLFDKSNNFIDISLVKIVTFGAVRYSEEEGTKGKKGYASSGRFVFIIVVVSIIGCVLISGGVLPAMMNLINSIIDKVTTIG